MKKKYISPEMDIIEFDTKDVIKIKYINKKDAFRNFWKASFLYRKLI